ncbi:MAG TPA: preprotein translocase subunit SecA [Thermoflexales bacterium]|nr:preprotein translocase subunit SecA [Thermoflexales bacterium]
MFKNFLTRLAGSDADKALNRASGLVDTINQLEPAYQKLTDAELRAKTDEFRKRYADGESLDKLMPEAFAAVREASRRVNNMRHYDVQLVGGALLHQGKIAEMRTGEGKTLVATAPLYLNALTGKGAHLITQNDYLAKRDAQWMGKAYHALGMTVGVIQSAGEARPDDASYIFDPTYQSRDDRYLNLRPVKRRDTYACDITYGTNNEFGFDYLRDNMTQDLNECAQRVDEDGQPLLAYAVIDEVDNLLIDEARTPLIISGPADEPSPLYKRFAELVRRLEPSVKNDMKEPDGDYIVDVKARNVTLTEDGTNKIEKWLGINNIYSAEHADMTPYLDNALRAHVIYEKDRDYVVADKGEIIIVDEFTGRLMYGRRFSEGLHQAIEAKEGVKIQRESLTYATITFQNFFRMYDKLGGMTGTAMTESEEFFKIYGLEVVPLPTNIEYLTTQKKLVEQKDAFVDGTPISAFVDKTSGRKYFRRLDYPDLVYKTHTAKFQAVAEEIAEQSKNGRPVLVGTIAIETSEMLSKMLARKGVKHEVLNAKQHEREAGIITQAGRSGAVTIATNMAGRGVDILLGGNPEGMAREALRKEGKDLTQIPKEEWEAALKAAEADCAEDKKKVMALGGLHVIGTERHEARRIDNQLRGRSARQGDQGSTRFYVALDDDLMRRFSGERVAALMDRMKLEDDVPLEYGILSKSIEQAQEKVEGYNFDVRKHVIQYDDVINKQREVVYKQRRDILEKDDLRDAVLDMVDAEIDALVKEHIHGDLPEEWDVLGLANEVRPIVPLPADFDPNAWRKGVREEIAESLKAKAEARYPGNLREASQALLTQVKLANETLDGMRATRDPLMRGIAHWAEKHLGDGLTAELAKTSLNDFPAERRDAINEAFYDGLRLFRDRSVLIREVDQAWVRHLTDLDELREGIGLRAYAQRDPLVSYRTEASATYAEMVDTVRQNVAQQVFNVQFNIAPQQAPPPVKRQAQPAQAQSAPAQTPSRPMGGRQGVPQPQSVFQGAKTSGGSSSASSAAGPKPGAKYGRNDTCPFCNQGKKLKHCDCEGARKWRGEA